MKYSALGVELSLRTASVRIYWKHYEGCQKYVLWGEAVKLLKIVKLEHSPPPLNTSCYH